MRSVSEEIAGFLLGVSSRDIPPEVLRQAKFLFLDTVGIALASSTMDFGRMALQVARRLGGLAESSLIGASGRVSAAAAALANGTLAHGLDYDDTREEAIVHTGCVAVPTALAVGEAVGASGVETLTAALLGGEVMCALGLVAPGRFHARFFHPTALCAPFAAAAVAGRLYGLTREQMIHALGIAGSQSAGIIEYLADGSWTKRLHPGWGAHAGVIAALLSREGFIGPRTVFEGQSGFFAAFVGKGEFDPRRLKAVVARLGTRWEIMNLTFKLYPCGSISQPYMDCALRIREQYHPQPEEIAEICCRTSEGPVPRLWEPLVEKHRPPNGYAAKFSLSYSIATILVRGRAGLAEFSDEAVRDRAVLRVAEKVRYEIDPSIDYPRHFVGHVRVQLTDGRMLEERQDHPRGGPEAPLTAEELLAKFRDNATLALPPRRVAELTERILHLEEARSLRSLVPLLRGASGKR